MEHRTTKELRALAGQGAQPEGSSTLPRTAAQPESCGRAAGAASLLDLQLTVGDKMLLDTQHPPIPSRSLVSRRWMGPFPVPPRGTAARAPNT